MAGSVSASTLAAVSIGTTLAGAGMSAIGQSQQASQQAAQANYQSQVARNQSVLAQRNAALATEQGEAAARAQGMKTLQIMGSQKASLASQGGDINSGSPASIIGDTAMAGKADQDAIRYNAALQAYGYEVQASGAQGTANAYSAAGSNATANLPFGIGSTLLGGAGSAAGKWYGYMQSAPKSTSFGPSVFSGTGEVY